jgi:hypothetical protein
VSEVRGILLAGILALEVWAAGELRENPELPIGIRVYNYAGLDDGELLQAKQRAVAVFRQAGLRATFVDCPLAAAEVDRYPDCASGREPVEFVLRLQPGYPPPGLAASGVSGFALPDTEGFGTFVTVFTAGADVLAQGSRRNAPVILGHLMAHEIGHLLLRSPRHSVAGIMRSGWGRVELESAAQGRLLFMREEAGQMRANWRTYAASAEKAITPE